MSALMVIENTDNDGGFDSLELRKRLFRCAFFYRPSQDIA
jgi:hypothetical protein